MVGKASEGGPSASSLTSLVPRQVMLDSCSIVTAAGGGKLAEKKTKKRRKGEREEKRGRPLARAALLRAIAAFLEGRGFTRTLAAFRSEAQLETDDGSEFSLLDLEEIICIYLESSKDPVVGSLTGPEEQDTQSRAPKKEEGVFSDYSEEPICNQRKKKVIGGDDNVKTESDKSAGENGGVLPSQLKDKLPGGKDPAADNETAENQLTECHMESKDQKRKKSKKVSKETVEYVDKEKLLTVVEEKSSKLVPLLENSSSLLLEESNARSKDKKKKKTKLMSDSPFEIDNQVVLKTSQEEKGKSKEAERKTDSHLPTFATENATCENPIGEDKPESKDKKKRKHNLIVEGSCENSIEAQNGSKSDGGKKGKSVSHASEEDGTGSHPKIENISSSLNTSNIDKKAKKRKRSASEETEVHVDNDATVHESKQKKPEVLKEQRNKEETKELNDSLLNGDLHTPGKKKISKRSEESSEKTANTPVNKQSLVSEDVKETPAGGIGQNETKGRQQEINGNLGKNEQEGNGSLKSRKAGLKLSTESKTVNAFRRVKIEEVKFADGRLQDNSYWAKDGAETGYGAKAQEILGQVRGRDFRHEKTKKKRGSYRGGQIDFGSHSVKFEYSDDEE